MTKRHTYKHLDEDSKLTVEISIRDLVERVVAMNYGVHRFLSHLVDVRRERLAEKIAEYDRRDDHDVADYCRRAGDPLVEGIEGLLHRGLV